MFDAEIISEGTRKLRLEIMFYPDYATDKKGYKLCMSLQGGVAQIPDRLRDLAGKMDHILSRDKGFVESRAVEQALEQSREGYDLEKLSGKVAKLESMVQYFTELTLELKEKVDASE